MTKVSGGGKFSGCYQTEHLTDKGGSLEVGYVPRCVHVGRRMYTSVYIIQEIIQKIMRRTEN